MPKKLITVTEMQQLDARLQNVLQGINRITNERLRSLLFDIDCAFDIKNDPRARRFYRRVNDELFKNIEGVS